MGFLRNILSCISSVFVCAKQTSVYISTDDLSRKFNLEFKLETKIQPKVEPDRPMQTSMQVHDSWIS